VVKIRVMVYQTCFSIKRSRIHNAIQLYNNFVLEVATDCKVSKPQAVTYSIQSMVYLKEALTSVTA